MPATSANVRHDGANHKKQTVRTGVVRGEIAEMANLPSAFKVADHIAAMPLNMITGVLQKIIPRVKWSFSALKPDANSGKYIGAAITISTVIRISNNRAQPMIRRKSMWAASRPSCCFTWMYMGINAALNELAIMLIAASGTTTELEKKWFGKPFDKLPTTFTPQF